MSLVEFQDIATYEVDERGFVCRWGETAARMLGYGPEEVMGRSLQDLHASPCGSDRAADLEGATADGHREVTGWATRKDGSRIWVSLLTVAVRGNADRVVGFACVLRNLSKSKAAQEEHERMFTLSVDPMCVAGSDGYFKRVNPAFTRVLGHSEAELLSRPYLDFVHPDDLPSTSAEAGRINDDEHIATHTFQNRYRCSDGTFRWLDWKTRAFGAERLIYAVARDVTEQRAVEQKLQEYARELERSNGELQQFAYVASHDLQEPLRAVAGCVQLLGERNAGKLDARSAELVSYAVDGAKRMQTLINDLLAFTRVGSKGINKAWIDTRSAVDKALRQLQVTVSESGAIVAVGALPHAWADPVQLTQAFQNLIGNAIKFRGSNQPEVQVTAEQAGDEIIFSVRDNGIGIAPEYHDRVFGVFQRLHSQRDYAGTGIGLAICKKIIERHGGRLWVESRAGAGANFRFTLPAGSKP